jgi:hypothetical protein
MSAVGAIVRADFLIRFRRASTVVIFLLLSALAYVWVPDPSSGKALIQVNGHRALYNSAAIGMATAMLATIFIGLVAFYVTSNAVSRDLVSRCGFVLASTGMKTRDYLLGKFLGNVVFLTVFVAGFMLVSMAMVLVRGEAPLEPLVFIRQYLILVPSTITFVAALAITFESIPWLAGRLGDVLYFFVWAASLGYVGSRMERGNGSVARWFDFSGFGYMFEETRRQFATTSMAIGHSPFDRTKSLIVMRELQLHGDALATRIVATILPLALLAVAYLFFHRFDPARVKVSAVRGGKWRQRVNAIAKPLTWPLTMLTSRGGAVAADARVAIAAMPLTAIAFFAVSIATVFAGSAALQVAIAAAGVFIAGIACRESLAGTTALVYAAPRLRERFVLWKLASTFTVALLVLAIPVLHTALTKPASLAAMLVGMAFVAASATALGIISSNAKTFIVVFLSFWYVVVNDKGATAWFDFMAFFGTPRPAVTAMYAGIAIVLLAAAEVTHRFRLRE